MLLALLAYVFVCACLCVCMHIALEDLCLPLPEKGRKTNTDIITVMNMLWEANINIFH